MVLCPALVWSWVAVLYFRDKALKAMSEACFSWVQIQWWVRELVTWLKPFKKFFRETHAEKGSSLPPPLDGLKDPFEREPHKAFCHLNTCKRD